MAAPAADAAWCDARRFEDADFDASAYVSEMRRVVPLERLRAELQGQLGKLRSDLVDVINDDYAEFIGLSEQLGNVDGSVTRLRAPLCKLKDSLSTVQERYRQELRSLRDCLDCQSQILSAKALLELVQDASSVMGKVEALARELPEGGAVDSLQHAPAVSQLLERIAGEVSRLKFYMTKGQDVAIIAGLQVRLDAVMKLLEAAMSSILALTLPSVAPDDDAATTRCLHASSLLGNLAVSNRALRERLVAPALATALQETRDSGQLPGAGGASVSFFLEAAKRTLEPALARLAAMCAQHADLTAACDPLGACVLPELHACLTANMPAAFSPGVPAAFHANYSACTAFLRWLEARAVSGAAVRAFRACAAYAAFARAWNLAVYFSLRFQDIAGAFDTSVHAAPAASASGAFAYVQSDDLLAGLQRCQAPDTHLRALADRFAKLQLQLLVRYGAWLSEARADETGPRSTTGEVTADFAGFDAGSMRAWAAAAVPDALVLLLADVEKVRCAVRERVAPAVAAQLPPAAPADAAAAVHSGFEDALERIAAGCAPVQAQIVGKVLEGAVGWLRHVKTIAAAYRMANRPASSQPSHYVANLLKAAQALQVSAPAQALSATSRAQLFTDIADAVLSAFHAAAADLLETAARTAASLSRLGRGKGSAASATADGDTSGKMQQQLRLDVLEFGRHVERLTGRPAEEMASFRRLVDLVPPSGA